MTATGGARNGVRVEALAAVLFALAHVSILRAIVLITIPVIFYVLLWRNFLSPFWQVDKGRPSPNPSART